MIEFLAFIFRDAWTFAGCLLLLILAGAILSAIAASLAKCRPLQGIIQVHIPSNTHYTDMRARHRLTTIKPADVHLHASLNAEHDSPHTKQSCESTVEQHGMANTCPPPAACVER